MMGNRSFIRKTRIALVSLLVVSSMTLMGCESDLSTGDSGGGEGTYTASGYEYRADVHEDYASVEYLDATVDINEMKFVRDDFDDQVYLVLEMRFYNDSSRYRSEGEEDTNFYMDRLYKAFVIQAVQDGSVIECRPETEAQSIEEANCYREIDSGRNLDCEMYFPVEPDSPVTVQVLNPDGEDTVMAELVCTPPDEIEDDF